MAKNEPIICITSVCNQKCIYCNRGGYSRPYSPDRIKRVIKTFGDSICIEGGEPTLGADLLKWVAYARRQGTRDIILVTNGFNLEKTDFVKDLLKAGLTMFNVHIPAHNAKLFNLITQTKGNFEKRMAALRHLISVAGPDKVRLTTVVNSVIGRFLPQYAGFITRTFPDILYIEINMVKVLGYVRGREWLVPRLSGIKPKLMRAFNIFDEGRVKFLTDGFPLCVTEGYEHRSIDAFKLAHTENTLYLGEKRHCAVCSGCTLRNICSGLRTDYIRLYGSSELKASKKDPAAIVQRAAHQLR